MAAAPSNHEIHDFITQLLKIWERTPSTEPAVFNDERLAAQMVWDVQRLKAVRQHCSTLGWIRYQFEGSKDYTLTEVGINSGREARRR
jgi:hypothetical protein